MEAVEEMKSRLKKYEYRLEIERSCLDGCDNIVQIGDYTVGYDKNNNFVLESIDCPTQWTDEAVKEILSSGAFEDNPNAPKTVKAIDWYNGQCQKFKESIESN